MSEDLMDNLSKMGLTSKQAIVYLSIAINKKTKISEITKETKIHQQDVSKILPKLEQMGLIIKSTTRPIIIQAIPLKIALEQLIKKQQENLYQQKKKNRFIIKEIEKKNKSYLSSPEFDDKIDLLDIKSQNYKNTLTNAQLTVRKTFEFTGARGSINQFLKFYLPYFKIPLIKKYNIKIRVIAKSSFSEDNCLDGIDLKEYSDLDITIKKLIDDKSSPFLVYSIVDDKQLRAIIAPLDLNQSSKVVSTNCIPIVKIAIENFERSWRHSNAVLLFSSNPKNSLN